jgi:hypothetical protein
MHHQYATPEEAEFARSDPDGYKRALHPRVLGPTSSAPNGSSSIRRILGSPSSFVNTQQGCKAQ